MESASFSTDQAEAVADASRDALGEAGLASKRDNLGLELKTESRFEQVKGKLNLPNWMLGIMFGAVMALVLKVFFPV